MCEEQHDYTLLAVEKEIGNFFQFPEFPSLKADIVDIHNNLCSAFYDKNGKCYWHGELIVTLRVNDKLIRLSDRDEKQNHISIVGNYSFMGKSVYIENYDRASTYLVFTVCHHTTSLIYHLYQPFTLVLEEQPSTGYSWELELPPEIQLTSQAVTSASGNDKVGGESRHTFVLKGVKLGVFTINATYRRWWEKDVPVTDPHNKKQYTVAIV